VTPAARGSSTLAVAAALGIVYVVWGSTYLAIAVMIESLPPFLAAGVRFLTAGLLMLGFLAARSAWRGTRGETAATTREDRPTLAHWRSALVIGTLLLLGGNGGVVIAEQFIPSGVAAVVIATVPIWLAVLDGIVTRQRPSGLVIAGLAAGLVGVAVLLAPIEGLGDVRPVGVAICVGAALSWAIGSLYARRAPLPRSNLLATGMEMLAGGAVLVVVGGVTGELARADPSSFSQASILALAYLVVFGSVLAFTAYTWLLGNVPVSTVGTYAYVNPIVAVALGAVFAGEQLTPRTLIASAVIIAAIVAMVSSGRREPEPESVAPDARAGTEPAATRRLQGATDD
jgi:drug/metabolite transporter (DMT)-like permease